MPFIFQYSKISSYIFDQSYQIPDADTNFAGINRGFLLSNSSSCFTNKLNSNQYRIVLKNVIQKPKNRWELLKYKIAKLFGLAKKIKAKFSKRYMLNTSINYSILFSNQSEKIVYRGTHETNMELMYSQHNHSRFTKNAYLLNHCKPSNKKKLLKEITISKENELKYQEKIRRLKDLEMKIQFLHSLD